MRRKVLATSVLAMMLAALAGCGREQQEQGDAAEQAGLATEPPAQQRAAEPPVPVQEAEPVAEAESGPAPPEPEPDAAPVEAMDAAQTLARADEALEAGEIEQAAALFQRIEQEDPEAGGGRAREGLARAAAAAFSQLRALLDGADYTRAVALYELAAELQPDAPEVAAFAAEIETARDIGARLEQAQEHAREGRRLEPEGDNAVALYRDILAQYPGEPRAQAGLVAIESDLLKAAAAAAAAGNYAESDRLLAEAGRVRPGSEAVQNASARIVEMRERRATELREAFDAALAADQVDGAEQLLDELSRVSAQAEGLDEMRQRVENARYYGGHAPGQVFQDLLSDGDAAGPEMVTVPRGSFHMGSPRGEDDRSANEGPRHEVSLARGFALGRTEVTVGQFRAFVNATGYRPTSVQGGGSTIYDERTGTMSERRGVNWQDDHAGRRADANLPVIHVSWTDAQAYADWLARETGKPYRLPSEAEFEYALRAGDDTRYPWGEEAPMRVVGNLTGAGDRSASGRKWVNAFAGYSDGFWGPAPAASFEPNEFGLHDMAGNVSEWVQDCWHDSYRRAPGDGSAWVNPGCPRRVVRGGSWASAPDQTRAAFRIPATPSTLNARLGFRVARDL